MSVITRQASHATAGDGGRSPRQRSVRRRKVTAVVFAFPALLLLGALVGYPVLYSIFRSLFDASGDRFIGLGNYSEMFHDPATLKAIRNSAIWVVVAPAVLTCLGLILAVLTEKVRWATAFKVLIFMPMAISFLATGITFRLVYEQDPQRGVLNAITVGTHHLFVDESSYPGARARDETVLAAEKDGSYRTAHTVRPGQTLTLGLVGLRPESLPAGARQAQSSPAGNDTVAGTVYLDFAPGGRGRPQQIDPLEHGLPQMAVELTRGAHVVARGTTGSDGTFRFTGLKQGDYGVRLPASNFAQPYGGVSWLGPTLVTPAIIGAYLWIWTGFSMVLIGAGLSALPREVLEAARIDGAGEWQIFRRVTVPLLAPVLSVVFVTLVINVMKVFDLVFIIAPGPVQQDANVLALQMWLVSFGGGNNQGLGSAIGVVLLLLVVPAMIFNIRRFRRSQA
ncbi:sugar ABC transporter permease [Streptomyces sp. H10-C2]|uniref:carbohydrate ABC transporter permease n=1 Tax=unclassified Streptomyces TaxID=2593676 RepID=UPI0024BB72AA|nr:MULTISPECIES: sugar ABC transporter permease [unclassified Streptomyces]MDJ0340968.1 sugar ABC transporter permease [Streptomyces sp. PH10-H1]MDJ0369800.1 sugar ABC transporter permease [Streptomyces sp. H10-C2]